MLKVLIADDEELSRSVIRHILEYYFRGEFYFLEAANGREAVCLALAERADLAFLDIEMPVEDGLTAGREIRQQLPSCTVVFLTAYAQFGYAKQAISMGASEYLVKPAGEREVAELVGRELARRGRAGIGRGGCPREDCRQETERAPEEEEGVSGAADPSARAARIAAEARRMVDEGYRQELQIEEAAGRFQLSVNHFNKIFKQFNGLAFREYIIRVRVEKAKEYLAQPQMNIREVGTLVGYADANYFSRIFKKRTGLTPIEYRNQIFFT